MRYLNRIIFINSATIRYAEVRLDGNVHFIGTQGVGKSTILRSVLFFYNGDTQKLGIPVEKKGYADYYFPYSDSYIIYEVVRETGNFCVLSFKSMNRICYRFIDSAYRQELFIGADGAAYDATEKIRASLDRHRVNYSSIVNTYDEYRNILYGDAQGKRDFRKYALMESKQYQNIPRTIQNVLLNSKLEAEFIKQTIISSLNEEEAGIDLTRYKAHLGNFETQLKNIEQLMERASRHPELKVRKRSLQEEQKILTTHYQEVTTQYDALIRTVENQLTGFLNEKEKQKLELENEFNIRREKVRAVYLEQAEQFRTLQEQQQHSLLEARNKIQEELSELNYRIRQCIGEQLYSQEITTLRNQMLTRTADMQKRTNDIAHSHQCIESLTRQWETEKQGKQQITLFRQNALKEKIETLRKEAERIGIYIENSKNSFYGWLNENVQEWEETIGRVCDESVLHQNDLTPQRAAGSATSLFGVTIDLSRINRQTKTAEEYLEEKQALEAQMADCIAQVAALTDAFEVDKEKLKKKYQPQIKEQKERIRQWDYEQEQEQRSHQSDELQLADWQKKARTEQEERLALLRGQTDECNIRLTAAGDELKSFSIRKEKELATRRAEMEKQIKQLIREKDAKQQILTTEALAQRQSVNQQKSAYEQEKRNRLKEQGADTDRLQEIAEQLAVLASELSFIEESRDTLTEYKKDKRDLLDKVPELKARKKQLEERLEQENERFAHELKAITEKLAKAYEQIRAQEESIRTNRENCTVYDNVASLDWYAQVRPYLTPEACVRVKTDKTCKELNDENSHDLGGVNLFSSGNEDQVKARAVNLLRELIREMAAYRKDVITLSDSFELKFRVEENQNDTDFVERLSNVGSEGTDILEKAMINIMLLNVFKEGASRKFKDFKLHCVMDEIGKLHPSNIVGILKFANDRNILLINGSPTEQIALAYKHIYKLEKDVKSFTHIKRIISQN